MTTVKYMAIWLATLLVIGCAAKKEEPFKITYKGAVHNENTFEGNYVPKDLNDCYDELNKLLKPEDIEAFKKTQSSDLVGNYHMGLGMSLRNNWGLWAGSRLSDYFNKMGLFHPDDISGVILDGYWHHLNNKEFDVMNEVISYEKYWFNSINKEEKLCSKRKTPMHIKKTVVMKYDDGSPYVMHYLLCEKKHKWIFINGVSLFEPQGNLLNHF